MKKYITDLICISTFVFVVALFFRQTVFYGKLPVPSDALVGLYHPWRDAYAKDYPRGIPFKNFLITDPIRQQISWRKIAIDELKKGRVPTWNPYSFSGASLIGNIQAGIFYPLNILFLLLPFPYAWTSLIILQPLLAGLFLYVYLRHKKISPPAALVGAISWSFSGFSIAWLTWGTIVHVALWLPLILLSIDALLMRSTRRSLWFGVLLFSLVSQFLAGHAQISAYMVIVSIVYAIFQMREIKDSTKQAKILLICFGLSLVLSAVVWTPLIMSLVTSGRYQELENWMKPGWFLPFVHLVQYIAPDFFGNPATLNYWGVWNYGEFIGYIGIVAVSFAGITFLQLRNREVRFWLALLGVTFLFLLPTPIAKIPFLLHIPILVSLQPTRLTVLADFVLVMLAAYGADYVYRRNDKKIYLFPLSIVVILAVLLAFVTVQSTSILDFSIRQNWLVSQRNLLLPLGVGFLTLAGVIMQSLFRNAQIKIFFFILFICLTTFDLLRFGEKFTPFTPISYFFPTTKLLSFLQNQPKPYRIASVDKELLPPNTSGVYGLESIEGYDPIVDARYEEYFAALARGTPNISRPFGFNRILTIDKIDSPLVPLSNVKYVLSLRDLPNPYLEKVFSEGETRVYQDTRALPRAYFVEKLITLENTQEIINKLYSSSFIPQKEAVVEQVIPSLFSPVSPGDSLEITAYNPSSVELMTKTSTERFLVVSNSWNKGWKATVDGKSVTIYRTNYVFQGLLVPEGSHQVILTYEF